MFSLDGLPPARPIPPGPSDPNATPYMLLCYHDEATWQPAGPNSLEEAKAEATVQARKINDEGRYLFSSPLHPAATATCVRVRDGKRLITDGPFAETNEVLGGFYLILADSRDVALKSPPSSRGTDRPIEVRQLFDFRAAKIVFDFMRCCRFPNPPFDQWVDDREADGQDAIRFNTRSDHEE